MTLTIHDEASGGQSALYMSWYTPGVVHNRGIQKHGAHFVGEAARHIRDLKTHQQSYLCSECTAVWLNQKSIAGEKKNIEATRRISGRSLTDPQATTSTT